MNDSLRHYWGLDPDVTFLNHGSFGATPLAVLEAQSELRRQMEAQPVRFFVREVEDLLAAARDAAAEFVGANPECFAFVTNATTGVNAVLQSATLGPGDEIVVTSHEYNACRNVVNYVAQRSGAAVRLATFNIPIEDPDEIVEAIAAQLSDATRYVLVDHVTSQTGLVLPLDRIIARIRETCDARILVDGAHAPGMLELDLETLGADYYVGNFHKWVCSPKGSAMLWAREELRDELQPANISHGANMPFESDVARFHFCFAWQGTFDPTAFLCVPIAIAAMAQLGGSWPRVREHNRDLALEGRRILNEALDASPICPDDMIGSIAAVKLPDGDGDPHRSPLYLDPLQDVLLRDHRIEVPIIPFPMHPHRLLRISAQLYNDVSDYERLAEVLAELV